MARGQSKNIAYKVFIWTIRLGIFFVAASVILTLIYRFVPPPVTATMLSDVFAGRGLEKDWMSLDEMDPDMPRAVIAAEDAKFCLHSGFDAEAIAKAVKYNSQGKRIRGGSSISQQTAKNVFLWQNGGYFRKGLEAWFTVLIENIWGKRRIMEVYLNVAETGIGTYGANAGAMRYFKHNAAQMAPNEAAKIAAVLPLPKERAAVAPTGFTRRYGNSIVARMRIVEQSGLDRCLK
jgi:monofunctional glycosyltransferase